MYSEGLVKRADLRLRAKYPDLKTSIFKTGIDSYVIYCDCSDERFRLVKKEFDYSIKPITAPVDLVCQRPENTATAIPSISDKDIAKDFEGLMMNKPGLLNLLIAKFPHVEFHRITDSAGVVNIHIASFNEKIGETIHHRFLSNKDRREIEAFLLGMKSGFKANLIEEEFSERPEVSDFPHNPVTHIYAANLRRQNRQEFSQRDEALWFDNIDKMFLGTFKKENLYFYDEREYSCYVDYSSFPNIDIRNHLLLFQTVFLTPPYEKGIEGWLAESKIKLNEFHELIGKGRVKLVLTQPEFRYDLGFLQEVYSYKPEAIISRRAIACLQQIDIIDLSDNYLINEIGDIKAVKKFSELVSDKLNVDAEYLFHLLIWPIQARRNSFEVLTQAGLMGLPSFGVNKPIETAISSKQRTDLEFEFVTNSPAIHLAHSLNATYFPFRTPDGYSDASYARIMGELLNFYKNATGSNVEEYLKNKERVNAGVLPISPINVIEINDYISITELEEVLSSNSIYPDGLRLIETLAGLSEPERKQRIAFYNEQTELKINRSRENKEAIELGTNVLMDAAGAFSKVAILGTMFTLMSMGGRKLAKALPTNQLTRKVEEVVYKNRDKANIHFLTKINRVARLRRW